jgi:hypothetical protein
LNKLQWFENLQSMTDKEVIEFARSEGIEFSLKEVRKLRRIFEQANVTWLFSGIPNEVIIQVHSVVGEYRLQQLMKWLR